MKSNIAENLDFTMSSFGANLLEEELFTELPKKVKLGNTSVSFRSQTKVTDFTETSIQMQIGNLGKVKIVCYPEYVMLNVITFGGDESVVFYSVKTKLEIDIFNSTVGFVFDLRQVRSFNGRDVNFTKGKIFMAGLPFGHKKPTKRWDILGNISNKSIGELC